MTAAFEVLFGGAGPRWFSIAAHRPFLEDLAFALDAAFAGAGPEALADVVVFTPTRRSGRELARAFVTAAQGRAVLLPQIRPVGDLDEGEPPFEPGELALDLPPSVTPLRRRFELARLVAANADLLGRPVDAPAAVELADALASFLDALQIEEIADPERIAGLVEGEMARHWQASARFLAIATEQWPKRLAELGLVDVAARRIALLRALAGQWRTQPPRRPIVVAGSIDAAPAMADLLAAAAEAPLGCVVLPGLDGELPDAVWAEVAEGHPQFALKRILQLAGVERGAVARWPTPEAQSAQSRARDRRRLVNEALRPADTTKDWRRVLEGLREDARHAGATHDPIARGLEGLDVCVARGEQDAGATCALLLREALETPGRTASLVTPDLALARRVSGLLTRWGIEIDSSAGAPLAAWPAGILISLAAATLDDPLAPAVLLALVKHTSVRLGLDAAALEASRRRLERRGLRGARAPDWAALRRRLEPRAHRLDGDAHAAETERAEAAAAIDLADRLQAAVALVAAPFAHGPASAAEAAQALARGLEALAADGRGRTGDLWAGVDGEAAAELVAGLIADGGALPPCTASGFAALVRTLLAGQIVRSGGRTHPRLRILGLIEARLVGADLVVLAGLEEGVWPAAVTADPFLSRPMRVRLGLPSPERRLGQAAHDFAQAACAREVVLVTRERRAGQPAVMSRWLWRLETLARGVGLALPRREDLVHVARGLDGPLSEPPPPLLTARVPEPRPPLAARPRVLSVTDVEKLVRDPYAVYARRVLGLRALERPDERIEARARGTAVHSAFEAFAQAWPNLTAASAPARFAELYVAALREQGAPDALMAREQVLAVRVGDWVARMERARRDDLAAVLVEQAGRIDLAGVTLTCRADRLEIARDGSVHVLDFKTGRPPTKREIAADFAPQLTLTAAMLMRGGFADLGVRAPGDLVYLRVSGREPAGEETVCATAADSAAMAASAVAGLETLLARYADPATPYRSRVAPRFVREQFSDYDALARVAEWRAADAEDDA